MHKFVYLILISDFAVKNLVSFTNRDAFCVEYKCLKKKSCLFCIEEASPSEWAKKGVETRVRDG